MKVIKKLVILVIAITSLVLIGCVIGAKFYMDWEANTNPKTRNQEQESKEAYSIRLGVLKHQFIAKVGQPDKIIISTDGAYEMLVYETTLPYSSFLTAIVEIQTKKIIEISHGEDWKEKRTLEGYIVPEIAWQNYYS